MSDDFILFHSVFPWNPRDTSREPREGRTRDTLGSLVMLI